MDKPVSAGDSGRQVGPSWAPGSWGQSRHKGQVHGAGQQPAPPTPGPCWLALGAREGPVGGSRGPCPGGLQCPPVVGSGPACCQPSVDFPRASGPTQPQPTVCSSSQKRGACGLGIPQNKAGLEIVFSFLFKRGRHGPEGRAPAEEERLSGPRWPRVAPVHHRRARAVWRAAVWAVRAWVCASVRFGPPCSCIVGLRGLLSVFQPQGPEPRHLRALTHAHETVRALPSPCTSPRSRALTRHTPDSQRLATTPDSPSLRWAACPTPWGQTCHPKQPSASPERLLLALPGLWPGRPSQGGPSPGAPGHSAGSLFPGGQQCRAHGGGGRQGVRLPPAAQRHHQQQGRVLHR